MTSIALERTDVIVGVDTHKDQHVAVTLDGLGGRRAELFVAATNDGYAQLLAWADTQGRVAAFGVEGTGSYGAGLASFLRRNGAKVIEVNRPSQKAERRANGKSDTLDAEHAAREVLAGTSTAVPKTADGAIEAIRAAAADAGAEPRSPDPQGPGAPRRAALQRPLPAGAVGLPRNASRRRPRGLRGPPALLPATEPGDR